MSVSGTVAVVESQQIVQRDARDPLGTWGARATLTGDATGGGVNLDVFVPAARAGRYVYYCYGVTVNGSGTAWTYASTFVKCRLLTNWPNIDPQAGIQGYSTMKIARTGGTNFTTPHEGTIDPLLHPYDRFIPLYAPAINNADVNIMELQVNENINTNSYFYEVFGYYWDREVLNQPGGPRHPGSD